MKQCTTQLVSRLIVRVSPVPRVTVCVQVCSTVYDNQCKTVQDEKCEVRYEDKCETKYEVRRAVDSKAVDPLLMIAMCLDQVRDQV